MTSTTTLSNTSRVAASRTIPLNLLAYTSLISHTTKPKSRSPPITLPEGIKGQADHSPPELGLASVTVS